MQDYIGIRVALYFSDDLDIAMKIVGHLFAEVGQSIDSPTESTFMPVRCNIIYQLPAEQHAQVSIFALKEKFPIDKTFEVQFRTILSEGWHEVEHDLRYKCEADWKNAFELSRSLNGVMATLETCDWSMIQIFEQLSYRCYKKRAWLPMLRHKMRMRMGFQPISEEIATYLNENQVIAKRLYRADRRRLLTKLMESGISIPLIPDNVIFLINHFIVRDEALAKLAPDLIRELLDPVTEQ